MFFLKKLSDYGKFAALTIAIASVLCASALAQKVAGDKQGLMYGQPGFVGESINLNVVKTDIRDILNYITEQYGVNFVIDNSVKDVPVTVNLSDVPWNIALDSVLSANNLGVQVKGSILRIIDKEKLAKEAAIELAAQEATLIQAPLFTEFLRLSYACAGPCAGGGDGYKGGVGGGGTAGGTGGGDGLLSVIKKRVSKRGSVETDNSSNTLIITDVRENLDAIKQLIKLLDQPQPQVEVEARIVIASRSFSRDIGFQLAGLVLGPRGSGASAANTPGSQQAGGSGGGSGGSGGQNTTGTRPGGIPVGIGLEPTRGLTSAISNTVIGLTTGIFGTAQISALLTAGEEKGQAKTIATPRITTINNRQAEIESGQQIPIQTTQAGGAGGGVVVTTQYVSVPLRLSVTPRITDAGTVYMKVIAENNTISRTIAVGGAPGINTQRMQTEVLVPDGGTTVVGGALLDTEGADEFRTPGLSNLPVLGKLFKRKAVSRNTSEILFFITPRIYKGDAEGEVRSSTLIQPVPLGNPASNSSATEAPQAPQQVLIPAAALQNLPTAVKP
jgi:type IV pilus assembly protein PilQ